MNDSGGRFSRWIWENSDFQSQRYGSFAKQYALKSFYKSCAEAFLGEGRICESELGTSRLKGPPTRGNKLGRHVSFRRMQLRLLGDVCALAVSDMLMSLCGQMAFLRENRK